MRDESRKAFRTIGRSGGPFSFGRKIRADDGSYLDGACFQVSDGQLFGSSRSKKLDDEPALWPLWGKQR